MKAILRISKKDQINKEVEVYCAISRSFVQAFTGLMLRQWSQGSVSIPTIDNTSRTGSQGTSQFFCEGVPGAGTMILQNFQGSSNAVSQHGEFIGVQVGTGTTAEASNQVALTTRVANGITSGTLSFCGTRVTNYQQLVAANTDSFDIVGIFENKSGGTIIINEVGIYCVGQIDVGTAFVDRQYCILRDYIGASPVSVLDTEFLKVTYTIEITS